MTEPSETRFAQHGAAKIAYRTAGDGPVDLVYFAGSASNVDMRWDHPSPARFLDGLAAFSRLIIFDRRGSGASDALDITNPPLWEEWAEDITAVMGAVGSERAALFAVADAGPMAILFAAAHPERVSALVLANTTARLSWAEDNQWGLQPEEGAAFIDMQEKIWGTPAFTQIFFPSRVGDESFSQWYAKYLRASTRPGDVRAFLSAIVGADVRHALPLVRAPTLVLASRHWPVLPVDHGRAIAAAIPDARLVELESSDGTFVGGALTDQVLPLVEEFVTGTRAVRTGERALATVMFTDLVGSTTRAASMGDAAWRSLLDEHRWLVRKQLERHKGREVKTIGDGFMAVFEGPGRAARCACAIVNDVRGLGMEVRAGIHTGECEISGNDVDGLAVHIGARVVEQAGPGEVLATSTVRDPVVGSSLTFGDRGRHQLKGVPGEWVLYAVAE